MMNTLYKSLTIAILIISTFISGINVDLACTQNKAGGSAASQRLADMVSGPYLKFSRLTTEDGLLRPTTVCELSMKGWPGYFGSALELVKRHDW